MPSDQHFLSCATAFTTSQLFHPNLLCYALSRLSTDDRLSPRGYYGAYRPLGFRLVLTQRSRCSITSNTPSQCCLIINVSGFCNSYCSYVVGSLALNPISILEDQWITLCLVSTLRLFRHGWPYQEYKTPADIALGVIETRKPPHHDQVVTPIGAERIIKQS